MVNKKRLVFILRIFAAIAVITSLVVFVPWKLVWPWLAPLPDTVQEQLEDAIGHGFDGIVVYVDRAGEEPAFYSAGWKNRAEQIPADPHSLFKIASIGKLYEAVSIAKLVHDGRLSLDKTLIDYFPELEGRIQYADSITLKMMVQHRSGIPSFTEHPGFWSTEFQNDDEVLELALDLPALFEPGEDYHYSNTNYFLISRLIERVSGDSEQQFIRERILEPLELENTFGSIHEVNLDDLMSGYYVGIEEDIKSTDYDSMIATAEDVGIFLRALNDGSLFEEGEQEIYSSIYVYEHTGLIPGYQSIARYHPDIDTVVIQFNNTTDFSDYTNWVLGEIVYGRVLKILRRQ
ncbi:MAG: serine hydrolase domain-containing protein [Xanthomonadales bacterium]|jgi:CubicO group peptidase (beta-lactamase class C family)|nr:serine hydrolase domain-containing protein [Xanthomonadales bacterium]